MLDLMCPLQPGCHFSSILQSFLMLSSLICIKYLLLCVHHVGDGTDQFSVVCVPALFLCCYLHNPNRHLGHIKELDNRIVHVLSHWLALQQNGIYTCCTVSCLLHFITSRKPLILCSMTKAVGGQIGGCCYDAAQCRTAFFFGAVQYGDGGGKWGRRRPRWLMVERAYLHSLWRASQAAHRWWATPDTPSAPLASIPAMHKVGYDTWWATPDASSALLASIQSTGSAATADTPYAPLASIPTIHRLGKNKPAVWLTKSGETYQTSTKSLPNRG